MNVDFGEHQLKAIKRMRNGCILCGGVGVGKTRTALGYYLNTEPLEDIIVITTARKRDSLDWVREAAAFGINTTRIDTLGGDGPYAGVLTVDSWNNISKYQHEVGKFFIFDEQRLVGSGAWVKSFLKIVKYNQWIMLSATPGDTWLDYIPVFVANGFYKNQTEFKRDHVIYNTYSKFPKVDRYVGVGKLVRLRNSILVDMPYARTTVRKIEMVEVEHDKELLEKVEKKRWHVYEARPLKDVAELCLVMRKVVNSDAARLEAVRSLMDRHPRLIVFYNFDYELEQLRTLVQTVNGTSTPCDGSMENGERCKKWKTIPQTQLGHTGVMSSTEESLLDTETIVRIAEWNKLNKEESEWTTSKGSKSASTSVKRGDSLLAPNRSEPYEPDSEQQSSTSLMRKSSRRGGTPATHIPQATNDQLNVIGQGVQIAEWNGHKHQSIPDSERWVYLVQYQAGAEAWNCIETDAMCFYSLTYSYRNFEQAQGRIDRLNTPFKVLYYYVLISKGRIDVAIWKKLKAKQNFNERDLKMV